jgi:KipI family sensor histidine kinase inhibitor
VTPDDVRTYWLSETAGVLEIRGAITLDTQRRIWGLAEHFRSLPSVREAVPGMNNLSVELQPTAPDAEALLGVLLARWQDSTPAERTSRRIDIPVEYGGAAGPDLDAVSRHTGLSPSQVIQMHCAAEYTVYFLGFLPGFAYLGGMDPRLATPRRREPRLAVPAGSVGIGGEQTGVYPLSSPGGWQLIGRSALPLFNPALSSPALLSAGDTVRFVNVGERL